MDKKLETFAHDIMMQCQKHNLTWWEVKQVMGLVSNVAEAIRADTLKDLKFRTVYYEEAAPASETKGRQDADETAGASDRELLIREYERRLALLKRGASTGDVIF